MTPEQIRAKQKAIQAYRQIIGGLDVLKECAPILICDTPDSLARMEADQKKCREGIEMLQSLPDTAEIFAVGNMEDGRKMQIVLDSSEGNPHLEGFIFIEHPEVPPEGPGVENPPELPPVLIA